MNKFLPERLAIYGVLALLAAMILFHLLILSGILPFNFVWGGRLQDRAQMLRLETASIAVTLIMLLVVAIRGGLLKWRIPPLVITIALWVMAVLFLLNTIGNLLSQNPLEKFLFTPLTALLSIFCFRLAPGHRRSLSRSS